MKYIKPKLTIATNAFLTIKSEVQHFMYIQFTRERCHKERDTRSTRDTNGAQTDAQRATGCRQNCSGRNAPRDESEVHRKKIREARMNGENNKVVAHNISGKNRPVV